MGIVTRGKGNKYLRPVVPKAIRPQVGQRDTFKLGTDSERLARQIESTFDKNQFQEIIGRAAQVQTHSEISSTITEQLNLLLPVMTFKKSHWV